MDAPVIQRTDGSHLRSSAQFCNFHQIVDALATNSLHLGSKQIRVDLDLTNLALTVQDDGLGIPKLQSIVDHSQHSSFITSLPPSTSRHCVQVIESLVSLSETAIVEVCSRAEGSFQTTQCILRAGKVLKAGLAPEQWRTYGTSITVRDIFYNRPVQKKALLSNGLLYREVEKCKHVLERLALVRPDTTFSLYDCDKKKFHLKLLRGRNQGEAVSSFFGHPPEETIASIPPIQQLSCAIDGWVVLPPHGHCTAGRQWIYVNKNYVHAPLVSQIVKQLYTEVYPKAAKWDALLTGDGSIVNGVRIGELQVLKKASNRHAMFVLHLQCSADAVEFFPDPDSGSIAVFREEKMIEDAVREAILAAWKPALSDLKLKAMEAAEQAQQQELPPPQHLSSHSAPGRLLSNRSFLLETDQSRSGLEGLLAECDAALATRETSQKPRAASSSQYANKRAKVLNGSRLALESRPIRPSVVANPLSSDKIHEEKLTDARCSNNSRTELGARQQQEQQHSQGGALDWHSRQRWLAEQAQQQVPAGSAVHEVWQQTKPSYYRRPKTASVPAHYQRQSQLQQQQSFVQRELSSEPTLSAATGTNPIPTTTVPGVGGKSRIGTLLSSWSNPTLMPSNVNIGVLDIDQLASNTFIKLRPAGLSRSQLNGGHALQQVDRKFIPIICSSSSGAQGTLIALIDQHAADERVQLELLRSRIMLPNGAPIAAAVQATGLHAPQPLKGCSAPPSSSGTSREWELLEAYGSWPRSWGWRWSRCSGSNGEGIAVTHVPVICGTALTATDLQLYLHQLEETRGSCGPPAGAIRVLNSKACRSAIMFEDELLPADCQELLSRLKETQLCFICAHGRPTTVPLLDLAAFDRAVLSIRHGKEKAKAKSENFDRNENYGSTCLKHIKNKLLMDLEMTDYGCYMD